jgi:hypothetical protein
VALLAAECAHRERAVRNAPERRQEGPLWLGSQSPLPPHESGAGRAALSGPARTAAGTGVGTLGSTIAGAIRLAVAVVLAFVGLGIGLGFVVGGTLGEQDENTAELQQGYAAVKYRMTKAEVRELLGKPKYVFPGPPEECWTYEAGDALGSFADVCFRQGKVYAKLGGLP